MKHPKLAVGFLLLVQAFHLASLQTTTASPRPTINESWNRAGPADDSSNQSQNASTNVDERESERTNEENSGTASGLTDEENLVDRQAENNTAILPSTLPPSTVKAESEQPRMLQSTVSPGNSNDTTPKQIIPTVTEKQSNTQSTQASTLPPKITTSLPKSTTSDQKLASSSSPEINNSTDSQNTTMLYPETPTLPTTANGLNNSTGSAGPTVATSKGPEIKNTSPSSPVASTVLESTTMAPVTTGAAAAGGGGGDGSDRGSALDSQLRSRQQAWGAVLGTAVVVACVGLVAYIIMRRKNPKGFTHRKLEEDFPSDPVLRLDNSEPLDLTFGRSGYTNPGLQSDDIQMSNIPGRP